MTRALIADDEPHLARYLRDQLLLLWPELDIVHLAGDGADAAARIAELAPDVAFLDIQMPGMSGLEVAQGIEGATRVVFVTAFDAFAVDAFEHAALDYVLKPVSTERLARTVTRLRALPVMPIGPALAHALHQLTGAPPRPRLHYIVASQGDRTRHIDVADVRFFQADDKYTVVASIHGEYLIRTTITDLAAQLDPDRFRQVHRSTLINLAWVDGTHRDDASRLFVHVRGHATALPVSRAYVHLFKAM